MPRRGELELATVEVAAFDRFRGRPFVATIGTQTMDGAKTFADLKDWGLTTRGSKVKGTGGVGKILPVDTSSSCTQATTPAIGLAALLPKHAVAFEG